MVRFAVRSRCGDCRARVGVLCLGDRCALDTPCLLLSTRKGLPSFVPPDLLSSLHPDALALHASPLHFLDNPSIITLVTADGLHNLVSLPDNAIAAFARDFLCVVDHDGSNKLGATFQTPFGRRLVKPLDYMNIINAMQPDIWASLPDEAPAWVTNKRNKQSVERTLRWLDCCLALKQKDMENGLGCVVGGASVEERSFSARETAMRDVSGFSICGFGLGENAEDRGSLLEAIMANLPDEKPRHISGFDMPEEVLQAVSAGIDIFDGAYPHTLTISGLAMVFPISMEEGSFERVAHIGRTDIGSDHTKINLRSLNYRHDVTPILDNCKCYTCLKHSKAYINHLLNTHEMLAQTLLDIHNIHHYLNFFRAIREAIHNGCFMKFKTWFVGKRRAMSEAMLISCNA